MNKSLVVLVVTALSSIFGVASANAALLLDQSPDTTLGVPSFAAHNVDTSQNFATSLTLAGPTQITGMSVFGPPGYGIVGNPVVFKIFEDVSSMPSTVLFKVTGLLDAVDNQFTTTQDLHRSHMTLSTPIALGAGTYWFGLSGGQTQELAQTFLALSPAVRPWLMQNDSLGSELGDVTLALQVEGSVVPLPGAVWLLGPALGGLGLMRRRLA